MTENEIAKKVVDICYHIHVKLGAGLYESVYEGILYYELKKHGFNVRRQHALPVVWKEIQMEQGFRADLIVEDKVILEIKSIESLAPVHKKQVLTYIRLANMRLGLLINFNVALIRDGIERVVNNLHETEDLREAK